MQFHERLCDKIWEWYIEKRRNGKEGYHMYPEILDKLKEIANAFINTLEINKEAVKDIVVTGSMASYNYTEHSDIDLHVIIDLDKVHKNCPIAADYLLAKKSEFNSKHDIRIYGIPVEVYAEPLDNDTVHNGLFSLNTGWIDYPKKIKPTNNDMAVKAKYEEYVEAIKEVRDGDQASILLDKIKRMRKAGLAEGGEFSVENLVFKKLRDSGYIGKLMDIKKDDFDKKLSLNKEKVNEALSTLEDILEKWGNNSGRYTNGTFGVNDDSEDKKYINNDNRTVSYKDREMSPDQYIKACAHLMKGKKKCKQGFVNKVEKRRSENRANIEKLKSKIASDKEQIDRPYIDYQTGRQEGLHRAIAAKELGHKKIPVRVFHSTEKGGNKMYKRSKKMNEALELLEEIATGIAGMMGQQPNPVVGKEMPTQIKKERRNTQKNADLRYKYKKTWGKKVDKEN